MVVMDISLPGSIPDIPNPVDRISDAMSDVVPTSPGEMIANAISTVGGAVVGIVGFIAVSSVSFLTGGLALVVGAVALTYGWSYGTAIGQVLASDYL